MNLGGLKPWLLWGMFAIMLSGFLGYSLLKGDRAIFLIGRTTDAHHQIELACDACHKPFGGTETLQQSCVGCHGQELKDANDKHPKAKFTDPRNADRVAALDARVCITCHREHRPGITRAMAVTMPDDYCFLCHKDIARDRPSHAGLAFNSCASAGCHNFHDNRALYEDFLTQHKDEPSVLTHAVVPARQAWMPPPGRPWPAALKAGDADWPQPRAADEAAVREWATTAHARAGVNCSGCHRAKEKMATVERWVDKPDHMACATCHERQAAGYLAGKHGMRLAQKLTPMTPAMARLPMRDDAKSKTLSCTVCHGAHAFDTAKAAVEACEGCHADGHTKAFRASPHFELWHAERTGAAPAGSGVTCAGCHMPRETHKAEGREILEVQHNQNANLRPNEKMIRSVCIGCHGLGFAIDALADPKLITNNFKGRPARAIPSIEWATARAAKKAAERQTTAASSQERKH